MKKFLFFFFLFAPSLVFGLSTHNYVCTDWYVFGGTASCVSNVVTLPDSSSYVIDGNGSYPSPMPSFALRDSTTYYVSAIVTGSGSFQFRSYGTAFIDHSATQVSGTLTDVPLVVSANGDNGAGLGLVEITTGAMTFSSLCISDTIGACAGGGGSSLFAEATSTVDQTERNFWDGWWTFFAVLVFMVWLFRGQK